MEEMSSTVAAPSLTNQLGLTQETELLLNPVLTLKLLYWYAHISKQLVKEYT